MATSGTTFDIGQTISPNRPLGLWRLMSGFRLSYLFAVISLSISALAKTSTFLLLRYFIDNVLAQHKPVGNMVLVALGFIGLALFEGGFAFTAGRLAAFTAENIVRRLRNYVYDHIQRLSFAYHSKAKTGELIQRATSDVDAIRRFYADQAIGIGRIVILFVINMVALVRLNGQLALVSVVIIPPLVGMSAYFFKRVSKAYEEFQKQEAKLSTTLQENLSGVRVVKAFARQDYERDKFEKDNWAKFQRGVGLTRMHAMFWPISDTLCGFQMLVGFLVGALLALDGRITIGTYMAYGGLIGAIIWPMRNLGRLIVNMSTGLVSYGRVTEMLKEQREPLAEHTYMPTGDVRGEIVFDQVGFAYADAPDIPVLKNISFRCAPGEVVALLGSTGCGKTSLVNLLPRFYDYTAGQLTLDGVALKEYSRHFLRQQIGIVEQEPFLFSRTIRENITYGVTREISDAEIEEVARAAAIHDVVMGFPEGYKTLVGEKGVTLSGGQKQRVAIARTLLKNPRILILDDSTSSVDTETEGAIREALERLMQGRTTFVIAHRIQSVMNANLILVLDKGAIVERGTHDELMAQEGIYKQIYNMQARIEDELEKEMASARLTV